MRNPLQVKRARRLRRQANIPEQKAWRALRQLRRRGYPVRRQHPVGPYIVDFAILEARLLIEIDGGIHRLATVAERDRAREAFLTAKGWRVLRFSAIEALHPEYLIREVLLALASATPSPQPLSPKGERGQSC